MEVYSKSDIGLVRKENQDSFDFRSVSPSCAWSVVCDGMGGVHGGKTASSIAVNVIREKIDSAFKENMNDNELSELLISAVEAANTAVYQKSVDEPDLYGMGTTCELVFIRNESVFVVHVGDSRTYAIRGGKILQLTEDHSLVQELVKRGELTQEQAERHPNKNYITRALGINPEVRIDLIESEFSYGDVILICSDGLTNFVELGDIVKTVHEKRGVEMVDTLVELAKSGGGKDNITVTVIY